MDPQFHINLLKLSSHRIAQYKRELILKYTPYNLSKHIL